MKKYIEKKINKVGDSYEYSFSFTQEDVNSFALVSGDKNPIHIDKEYASKSLFKKRIIHGFLGGSVFSKVFGNIFPGEGTFYLKQSMTFYNPMYVNELYKAKFLVKKIIPEKNRAIVDTIIVDKDNQIIIEGEALIKNKNIG